MESRMSWQDTRSKLHEAALYVKQNKILDAGLKSLLSQIPVVGGVIAAFWDNVDLGQAEKATEVAKFLERLSNQEEAHFETLVSHLEEQKQELIAGKQSLNSLLDDVADVKKMTEHILLTGNASLENQEDIKRMFLVLFSEVRGISRKMGISSVGEALEARVSLSESDKRKIDENVKVYSAIRETGIPVIPSYSHQMGLVAVFQRRYLDAEYHFKEALQADAEYAEADIGLGLLYQLRANDMLGSGDFPSVEQFLKQAEMHINRALSLDHFDLNALVQAGYIYKEYGQQYILMKQLKKAIEPLDKAKQHFEFVLERDSLNASAHNGLGNFYYLRNNLDSAIDQHEKAILLRPDYLFAHHDLGGVYYRKGKTDISKRQECFQKALAEFKQALELNEQQRSLDENTVYDIQIRITWLGDYLAQN
jgi:tetratricopeptide (TPR) repeat protein